MSFAQLYTSDRKPLTLEEKRKALLLLAELRARGIPIPQGLGMPDETPTYNWNLDDNGYFKKVDGKSFSPRQVLVDFIQDPSRFILLKSGRGGGKSAALS